MTSKLSLSTMTLKNFATFENQTISFHDLFNGIVGETGSGKSLILDAFQFILGGRSDKKLVRKGHDFALIEASFKCLDPQVKSYFNEIGYPVESEEIIIKRIIYAQGSSKSFINHMSCNASTLQRFARKYIDLIGQFENQKLMGPNYQLKMIDLYGKMEAEYSQFHSLYQDYKSKTDKLASLKIEFEQKKEKEDYIKYQLSEFESIELSPDVEKSLLERKDLLLNWERATKSLSELQGVLTENENSLSFQAEKALNLANQNILPKSEEWTKKIRDVKDLIEDLSFDVASSEQEPYSSEELNDILSQLDSFQKLKRKFSCSTDELQEKYQDLSDEFSTIEKLHCEIKSISKSVEIIENDCYTLAKKLHDKRLLAAKSLSQTVTKKIRKLNMKEATLNIKVVETEALGPYGISSTVFEAETNKGEGYFPLKKIASGGELSRVLLALRQTVSHDDTISIFFFDEIDTGIGGETANKIASLLKDISVNGQVMTITHLPQIAKMADQLIIVEKSIVEKSDSKRTVSTTQMIKKDDAHEILKVMAGLNQ